MAFRALLVLILLCLELRRARGDPHPCLAAENVPRHHRRFFSFAPSNILSIPPLECAFVFGGAPGTRLRLAAYNVQTRVEGVDDGVECREDALRVYDLGHQGLQLMATYCGLLRRGQVLTTSSNIAVVTFSSDSNNFENAFSLIVDSVDRNIPCLQPVRETKLDVASWENATLSDNSTATQLTEFISTTDNTIEKERPMSDIAENETDAFISEPEGSQRLESSTATANNMYTTTDFGSKEPEEGGISTELGSSEEMVGNVTQQEY